MFLQDQFAAVELRHRDGISFEVWWFYEGDILAVSHCPDNYPATTVHTMTLRDANKELRQLVTEGWAIQGFSEEYRKLNPKVETYKAKNSMRRTQ